MRTYIIFLSLLLCGLIYGQVGINTDAPTATMDIRTTAHNTGVTAKDGILVPRVNSLTANGSVQGQLVYLIADQGQYTKGFHYWDPSKTKWVKVGSATIDNTKDSWVNDAANNRVQLGTLSDGVTVRTDAANIVIKDNGNLGIRNINPQVKLDVRRDPESYTPGNGRIALGTTANSANASGAGALRYDSGKLQYSDGANWTELKESPIRAMVVAKKISTQTFNNTSATPVTGWINELDLTGNFNAGTGIFTAPRTGYYLVSFGYSFTAANNNANSRVEAILYKLSGSTLLEEKKAVTTNTAAAYNEGGTAITFVFLMNQGESLRPVIWHNTGSTRSLRVLQSATPNNASDDGFVHFAVKELY